jgi:hypothetical protein
MEKTRTNEQMTLGGVNGLIKTKISMIGVTLTELSQPTQQLD